MKILMVNKFYYIKGGSETYYFALKQLFEEHGHTVIDFSMQDPQNFQSDYNQYFVKNIDYNVNNNIIQKARIALNIIYSFEAKKKIEELIKKERPDLIHLHIFQHQISPSILDVIKKYNIPTVYTAHDLKMLCLNYKMMHHGKICEKCLNQKYYYCLKNKCVKNSFVKSGINVVEGYFHKWHCSYDAIDKIITPSLFYKEKFENFGIQANRVVHIPNFINGEVPNVEIIENSKKYFLYFGRLSEEKGIITLIKAAEIYKKSIFYIAGTGPLEEKLKLYVQDNNILNIIFLGFLNGQKLTNIVGNAKAVIIPSEWYENGPYSAIEALQLGRPIIGAKIGGIPEVISNDSLLFESGNVNQLIDAIKVVDSATSEEYKKLEQDSLKLFGENHTSSVHYSMLKKVYNSIGISI